MCHKLPVIKKGKGRKGRRASLRILSGLDMDCLKYRLPGLEIAQQMCSWSRFSCVSFTSSIFHYLLISNNRNPIAFFSNGIPVTKYCFLPGRKGTLGQLSLFFPGLCLFFRCNNSKGNIGRMIRHTLKS